MRKHIFIIVFFGLLLTIGLTLHLSFDNSNSGITMQALNKYISKQKGFADEYSYIHIIEEHIDNEKIYLAQMQKKRMWNAQLYIIHVDNNKIVNLTPVNQECGELMNAELFEYEIVKISQGNFIALYSASHIGNGNLELFSLNNIGKADYSLPAIDIYYEASEETAKEYDLSNTYGQNNLASSVYLGGKLNAEYSDINKDGNTDITLKGIQQIFSDRDGEPILKKEYFCKYVYLYHADSDTFQLDDALSMQTFIMQELS